MARARNQPEGHQPALISFCRQALRGVLLAGSLTPLACEQPTRPAPPSKRSAQSVPDAAIAPRSVFEAETDPPVMAARDSASFARFPCGAPVPERAEQERIWNDPAQYERYSRMAERLELDLRARSFNLPSSPDYVHVSRGVESGMLREVGRRLSMILDKQAEHGAPCAGASDKPRCQAELKRQSDAIFAHERCDTTVCKPFFYQFAQTTKGDKVRTWVGEQQLKALFGEIDSPLEGWFMLMARQEFPSFSCGEETTEQLTGSEAWRRGPSYRTTSDGYLLRGIKTTSRCTPLTIEEVTYEVTRAGKVRQLESRVLSNQPDGCVVGGRRPPGHCTERGPLHDVGNLLARAADLESASIDAFALLADELAALAAPRLLIERTLAARSDEQQHAASMTGLATRFGAARVFRNAAAPRVHRDRFALALDNAREGCVRELFGALLAAFQASRAQLPALREAFAAIARDELRHAALSWDLADWLEQPLSTSARAQLVAQRRAALAELRAELSEPSAALRRDAGLPSLAEAQQLSVAVEQWLTLRAS